MIDVEPLAKAIYQRMHPNGLSWDKLDEHVRREYADKALKHLYS